jgi:ubiquinone/menaquinone biosynthesis C-methylase UbiE
MNRALTINNYNRMSRWYDWFSSGEKHFTRIGLKLINVIPGEKVLEIGFGTGQSLVELAGSIGKTGKVYGIDISDGMLAVANRRITRAGLSDRVDLRLGDATTLPFEDKSFNAVFISFTLELFDTTEIPQVLAECKRILMDDGRLCVVSLEKKEIAAVRIYEWFHAHFPILVDCRPIYLSTFVEGAGFTTVEVRETAMWGLPVMVILARKNG